MAYQVLARKWRPHSFAELVGQEHVQRVLSNALTNDRLHHAYLFTGTRGVGKTTIARILAKSLNCETKGVSAEPCGQCDACLDVDKGCYADLIEVDAASRTKVEDTRELLENVPYAPSRGHYKVYLIDEVHMLSISSFNALLKTLEEPPEHIKFLFATTDPQKLPATVLSRCLQFNLKRLSIPQIETHLAHILTEEKIPFVAEALRLLAKAADGSMRDALSLLDQAIAFSGAEVQLKPIQEMLGSLDSVHVVALLKALAAEQGQEVMAQVAQMADYQPDYAEVLASILLTLQQIALYQQVPSAVDDSRSDYAELVNLAENMAPELVQLFYQIALLGRRDLNLAVDGKSGFEMVLLRMLAFQPYEAPAASPKILTSSPAPTAHHAPPMPNMPDMPPAPPPQGHASPPPDNFDPIAAARAAVGLPQKKKP